MEYSSVQLNDLPEEILLITLKKLHNFEVLYSLIGANGRLNEIAHDSIFTRHVSLRYISDDLTRPLPNPVLNHFCSQVLPDLHHEIKWLDLESSSIERILLATNYPNLYGIGLYNTDIKTIQSFCTDKFSAHINKNQISSFIIDIIKNEKQLSSIADHTLVFTNILNTFKNVEYLNFASFSMRFPEISFNYSVPSVTSSNLLELHISLGCLMDCLYLFDGRFDKLHTVHINISSIFSSDRTVDNQEKLPNLKCFSLHCESFTDSFELILILLQRMSNLEKLDLSLTLSMNTTFIDGNYFKTNIINHMPRLDEFKFNILSTFTIHNQIYLPSKEDIQHTFSYLKNNQIICCVDYARNKQHGQCHIYTYPYKLIYYRYITNNFPGGLFHCVRLILLWDEYPFEHEFLLRISQSFPFVKNLNLRNSKPQNNKLCIESSKDNPIIKYPHLTDLVLNLVHNDYIEQFLTDTKVCLPNTVELVVYFEKLKTVTHNFTRDTTRINCAKLKFLCLIMDPIPQVVKDYFPNAKIY